MQPCHTMKIFFRAVILAILFFVSVSCTDQTPLPQQDISQKTQDFSVWLIPQNDEHNYAQFQKCIEDLSGQHSIAAEDIFIPHVTLYWGRSTDLGLQSIAREIQRIARNNEPVTLTIAGMGATRDRFKSLFITFSKAPVLHQWSDEISNVWGVQKTGYILLPHLSLFYPVQGMEMPLKEKIAMMNDVMINYGEPLQWFTENYSPDREFDRGYTIVFDRIQLRREDDENKVSSWVPVSEYTFSGVSP